MGQSTISFRDQASGRLADLLRDEGLSCAESHALLSYLSGALVSLQEEGVDVTPTLLICEDLDEFLRAIPGATSYRIGSCEFGGEIGSRILKECGVLARGGWHIYIQRCASCFEFGVVSYPETPLTVTLRDAITIASSFVLMVRKASRNTVELTGGRGNSLTLVFSTVRDSPAVSPESSISGFIAAATFSLPTESPLDEIRTYLKTLVTRVIDKCHGTILVVLRSGDPLSVSELQDYIALDPPLDFGKAFTDYRVSPSPETILKLQSFEALFSGLVDSDGIVMFSDTGMVVGYRAFFRPASGSVAIAVVGGARRRAYEGVCAVLGSAVVATMFRSQDGLTLFKEVTRD